MNAAVLKEELIDIREIVMINNEKPVEIKITQRGSIQQKLWDLFDLGSLANRLPYTNWFSIFFFHSMICSRNSDSWKTQV